MVRSLFSGLFPANQWFPGLGSGTFVGMRNRLFLALHRRIYMPEIAALSEGCNFSIDRPRFVGKSLKRRQASLPVVELRKGRTYKQLGVIQSDPAEIFRKGACVSIALLLE